MTENTVDLKRLIYMIKDTKNLNANLILDDGCVFDTADPKPLVKVINYIINYLEILKLTWRMYWDQSKKCELLWTKSLYII